MSVQLILGDSVEAMMTLPAHSVDLILCDLPYGTTECKWDSIIPFPKLWEAYDHVAKENAAIVLTACQPFTSALIMSNIKMFKSSWIWVKTNATGFANAKKQQLRVYEDIAVFYKKQPVYNPQGIVKLAEPRVRTKETGEIMGRTGFKDGYQQEYTNYPKNVLSFPSERGFHPTQKPIPLMAYLIETYTNPGALVLDNCMGSGTTGLACVQTGRDFIGIDNDPKYYAIAEERITSALSVVRP